MKFAAFRSFGILFLSTYKVSRVGGYLICINIRPRLVVLSEALSIWGTKRDGYQIKILLFIEKAYWTIGKRLSIFNDKDSIFVSNHQT